MSFSYNSFAAWLDITLDKMLRYRTHVVAGLVGVVLLIAGSIGFNWYWNGMQESAQKEFVELARYFEAPVVVGSPTRTEGESLQFASEQEKWAFIAQSYEKAYSRLKRTGVGPMFKVYEADALLTLGKHDDALAALELAVRDVKSREVQDFLKLKVALVRLDGAKSTEAGLAALKTLAADTDSFAHEAALYNLGFYYFAAHDVAQAKNYWQQLMVKYGMQDAKYPSTVAEQVRGKLKLISSDW